MTTSGTVSLTTIDAVSTIEHAARRCGVLTTALTSEMLLSARENLFMILSNFSQKGLMLWCVQKLVYALSQGQSTVALDIGVEDVLNVLYRRVTQNSGSNSLGVATFSPASSVQVGAVALDCPSGSYSFVLEGSNDNVFWSQYGAKVVAPSVRSTVCFDADTGATLLYWRVREVLTGAVPFFSTSFLTGLSEIPITKMSLDTYASLPNKLTQGNPNQYLYERLTPQQDLKLWPTPIDAFHQLVVWNRRHVQDVGDLSNTLEVPQRWNDPVISELATRVCLELPKELVLPDRYAQLVERAERSLSDVLDAEIDGAPIRIVPNIRPYTR